MDVSVEEKKLSFSVFTVSRLNIHSACLLVYLIHYFLFVYLVPTVLFLVNELVIFLPPPSALLSRSIHDIIFMNSFVFLFSCFYTCISLFCFLFIVCFNTSVIQGGLCGFFLVCVCPPPPPPHTHTPSSPHHPHHLHMISVFISFGSRSCLVCYDCL